MSSAGPTAGEALLRVPATLAGKPGDGNDAETRPIYLLPACLMGWWIMIYGVTN